MGLSVGERCAEKIACVLNVISPLDYGTQLRNERKRIAAIINQEVGALQTNTTVKHQAEAWCLMVAELIVDFGLTPSEPGKVALEQVQNFLRRKLIVNQEVNKKE